MQSKEDAIECINSKKCLVNGVHALKISSEFSSDADIKIVENKQYVGRGSEKLLFALEHFEVDVAKKTCADFGSSTGGFTDVMLQRGASKVYAIDTAKGELHWKLRKDQRVVVWEGMNVSVITEFDEEIDFISVDISLVSLVSILPIVKEFLSPNGDAIVLIKPQYEISSELVPEELVPEGGVIGNEELEMKVCEKIVTFARNLKFFPSDAVKSSLKGRSGNQEYLIHLRHE